MTAEQVAKQLVADGHNFRDEGTRLVEITTAAERMVTSKYPSETVFLDDNGEWIRHEYAEAFCMLFDDLEYHLWQLGAIDVSDL